MGLLEKKFDEITSQELKAGIKQKFKTIARFCAIAELDYKHTMNALSRHDKQALMDLYIKANALDDMPLENELTKDQKLKIRIELLKVKDELTVKKFCEKHGFDATWISRLLSDKDYSAVRVSSPNLKRLLQILNLEL